MSVILNETKVYPGWELQKNEMAVEEKALLISLKQNYIFLLAKFRSVLRSITSAMHRK